MNGTRRAVALPAAAALLAAACAAAEPDPTPEAVMDATPAAADVPAPAWAEPLDSLVRARVEALAIPGFAIGVVEDGRLAFARGYGVERLGGTDPVTPRSLFHTASVTKPFVATAIAQLVEDGAVELDAPVTRYLPYFRLRDEASTGITVRQLLAHTAGMPDVSDYAWDRPEHDEGALERWVRGLADSTLIAAPGERFQYSNIGFEVLGDVVAKVAGVSFEDYVHREILEPLGMASSTLRHPDADPALLTTPHRVAAGGGPEPSEIFPYNRRHAPSSTLVSNVEDMARWARANLNRGELDGRRILAASSYDALWGPRASVEQPMRRSVGMSWFLGEVAGHRFVEHGGGDRGYLSWLVLAPDDGAAVIVLANYEGAGGGVGEIAWAALRRVLDLPEGGIP